MIGNKRVTAMLLALGAAMSPIGAAAARLRGGLVWGGAPKMRSSRLPGRVGYRPAAPWVPNPNNGLHWERGQLAFPAGKGAHCRHDFKAAQKAARKAKSAKRRHAFERKHREPRPLFAPRLHATTINAPRLDP